MKIEVKLTLKIGLGIDLCRYKSDPKVYSHAWSDVPSYIPLMNRLFEFQSVPLCRNQYQIGHLQYAHSFRFKARLRAKPLT